MFGFDIKSVILGIVLGVVFDQFFTRLWIWFKDRAKNVVDKTKDKVGDDADSA